MGCDAVLWMWAVGCGGMNERKRKKEQQFLPHKRGGDGRGASMMQHVANIYPTLATAAKKRLKKLHSKILREGVISHSIHKR